MGAQMDPAEPDQTGEAEPGRAGCRAFGIGHHRGGAEGGQGVSAREAAGCRFAHGDVTGPQVERGAVGSRPPDDDLTAALTTLEPIPATARSRTIRRRPGPARRTCHAASSAQIRPWSLKLATILAAASVAGSPSVGLEPIVHAGVDGGDPSPHRRGYPTDAYDLVVGMLGDRARGARALRCRPRRPRPPDLRRPASLGSQVGPLRSGGRARASGSIVLTTGGVG